MVGVSVLPVVAPGTVAQGGNAPAGGTPGSGDGQPDVFALVIGGAALWHGYRTASLPYALLGGALVLSGLVSLVLRFAGVSVG